jgi:PAS domain S-box-containing protein
MKSPAARQDWDDPIEPIESFFRTLAETIPQMVWTKDANGLNDYCNQRFSDFMGITMDEFIHNSWIVAHPDDVARGQAVWRASIAAGVPYETELRLKSKGHEDYRWFLVRAVPYHDTLGRVIKWFGTTTDIDDQKRYSQQQEETVRILVDLFSPTGLPTLAKVALDAVYVPAEHLAAIGGDFYEALVLRDGRLLFAIGDVAGHGLGAAVAMERVRNAIVTAAMDSRDPSVVLTTVNRALTLRSHSPFVTALVGFLDPESGRFTYACAGHQAPVIAAPDSPPRLLPYGGMPLGVDLDPVFPTFAGQLDPGGMLLLYTDGITEFRRDAAAGERLMLSAVGRVLREHAQRPAEAIRQAVLGDESPADDVALLTITYDPTVSG